MDQHYESKQAESCRSDRGRALAALLGASQERLALLDPLARFLAVNDAFARSIGGGPDTIEGKGAHQVGLPPAAAQRLEAQVARVAAGGGPLLLPGVLPNTDMELSAVSDDDGIWAVAARAPGASAPGEAALAEARREVEEARRGRAAMGRFLSTAGHDLRQPFQAMQLFHHLLAGRQTDPQGRELAERMGEAMRAAEDLVQGLIGVAKLDAGLIQPAPGPVVLDDVLGRLLDRFGPSAEAKGLRFAVRPSDAVVRADAALLERLLAVLVANAVRFTDRGGVLLGTRRRGDAVRVEVWDTGVGIPPDDLPAIFDDFHKVANASQDRRKGQGLGLATARRLAALLDHPLSARSREGRGSVFAVTVPLAGPEEAEASRARDDALAG